MTGADESLVSVFFSSVPFWISEATFSIVETKKNEIIVTKIEKTLRKRKMDRQKRRKD